MMGTDQPTRDPCEHHEFMERAEGSFPRSHLLLIVAICLIAACSDPPEPTPDCGASVVAIERAIRATLTAEASVPVWKGLPSPTPRFDAIATGVAVQRAIAATLTAERTDVPAAIHPVVQSTPTPDLIATGVAIQRAIAATLTAGAPSTTATLAPPTPAASSSSTFTAVPKQPTHTPLPTLPGCIWWHDVGGQIGAYQCVCGVVAETYDDPNSPAFFINFDANRIGYYAVSFNLAFHGLEGKCVRICGVLETYRGRPQTVISEVDQLRELDTCP